MTRRLVASGLTLLVVACTAVTPSPTPFPGEGDVKTYSVVNIDGPPIDLWVDAVRVAHLTCGMNGVDLLSRLGVPPLPWRVGGRRAEILWPLGYSAAVRGGQIVVLDGAGQRVAQVGPSVSGGCVTRNPDVYVLVPPFS